MNIEDFDYTLPKDLIAQHPKGERTSSRLLLLDRTRGTVEHKMFGDIAEYLSAGDTLVLNETRVFPARLAGVKQTGGKVDILLLERQERNKWYCLAEGVRWKGEEISLFFGDIPGELTRNGTFWILRFLTEKADEDIIAAQGVMPLPRYIKRGSDGDPSDFERYQTVYARLDGSIAAPTAGFHFSGELIGRLEAKGVEIIKIVLHIGIGTFLLIKTAAVEDHKMHREYYEITAEAKERIDRARAAGRRIVACGTSVVRTLETIYSGDGSCPLAGYTDLYIHPGHRFKAVDAMITNLHLPRSTPLMLVSALAGRENILSSYREAMSEGYRFYSYGDAMFII